MLSAPRTEKSVFTEDELKKFYDIFVLEAEQGQGMAGELKRVTIHFSQYPRYTLFYNEMTQLFPNYQTVTPFQATIRDKLKEEAMIEIQTPENDKPHPLKRLCCRIM